MDDPMHHSLTRFMGHSILPSFVVQKNVESSAGDEHTRSSWLASASKLPVTIFGWPSRMLKGQKLTKSRPPVWGPESVVLDPRIQAVHAKMRRDLLVFGGCFAFVSSSLSHSISRFDLNAISGLHCGRVVGSQSQWDVALFAFLHHYLYSYLNHQHCTRRTHPVSLTISCLYL